MSRSAILDARLWLPVEGLSTQEFLSIKSALTLEHIISARFTGFETNKILKLYEFDANNRLIGVPRQWGMAKYSNTFDIKDQRTIGMPGKLKFNFPNNGDYRPGQLRWVTDIITELRHNKLGTIGCALPGFGKTALAINIACTLGLKTIVLVHKSFLMEQWIKAIKDTTGADAGVIWQNQCNWQGKSIVVAMVQSLVARDYDPAMKKAFSLLIADECFHPSHELLTPQGWKPVHSITLNSLIAQYDPYMHKLSFTRPDEIVCRRFMGDLFGFQSNEIDLLATPNHQHLVYKKDSVGHHKIAYKNLHKHSGLTHLVYPVVENNKTPDLCEIHLVKQAMAGSQCYLKFYSGLVYCVRVPTENVLTRRNGKISVTGNCHRMGAPSWIKASSQFPVQYVLGISATPRRLDKMDNAFFWTIGNVSVRHLKHDLKPRVYRINFCTALTKRAWTNAWDGKQNLAKLLTQLGKIPERNKFIVNEIVKMWKAGRKLLLLSHRKEHLERIKSSVDTILSKDGNVNQTGYYVGGMKKGERQQSEKRKIILATFSMCSEGFDVPDLDTLILATPASDVEQACGRILRKHKDKQHPVVLDICDDVRLVMGQARKRLAYYVSKQFEVTNIGF